MKLFQKLEPGQISNALVTADPNGDLWIRLWSRVGDTLSTYGKIPKGLHGRLRLYLKITRETYSFHWTDPNGISLVPKL